MSQEIIHLLHKCTVRVCVANDCGTGFFIAPNLILTCYHVIESEYSGFIDIFYKETQKSYTAEIKNNLNLQNMDLALLQLSDDLLSHPCIYFDSHIPNIGCDLYAFGFPRKYPEGDSATFKFEGESYTNNKSLYKLKEGEADFGLSGSPLLNMQTGGICAIISLSRQIETDLGARAIPTKYILSSNLGLENLNNEYHKSD